MSGECDRIAVDLSAYFDEELDPGEAAAVKAHLDGCARCRAQLDKMRGLRRALNSSSAATLPEHRLLKDLMRALQGQEGKERGESRAGENPGVTRER